MQKLACFILTMMGIPSLIMLLYPEAQEMNGNMKHFSEVEPLTHCPSNYIPKGHHPSTLPPKYPLPFIQILFQGSRDDYLFNRISSLIPGTKHFTWYWDVGMNNTESSRPPTSSLPPALSLLGGKIDKIKGK